MKRITSANVGVKKTNISDGRSLWDETDAEPSVQNVSQDSCAHATEISPYDLVDEILLSTVDGVGPVAAQRLLDYFGSAKNVLRASEQELRQVEKIGPSLAQKIAQASAKLNVENLIQFCVQNDVKIISIDDVRYPERLRHVYSPPRILYVRGDILPRDRFAVAMVGTRNATNYGRKQAARLARELVETGFTVVSGLALGIDGASHRAALDARGRTIAVLGGGVVNIYPREHEDLAGRIVYSGALVSEYHPLTVPLRGNFPARNRIISGLTIGTLVVESGASGGSLITARNALEQGREVFAVPGPVDSPSSQGCNQLIKEGAFLVESVDDIVATLAPFNLPPQNPAKSRAARDPAPGSLGISAAAIATIARPPKERDSKTKKSARVNDAPSQNKREAELDKTTSEKIDAPIVQEAPREQEKNFAPLSESAIPDEKKIVDTIGARTLHIDELVRESGLPASRVIGLVAALEFKGVLARKEGNAVERRRI